MAAKTETTEEATPQRKLRKMENPETRGKFLDHILDGNSIASAARECDVDYTTVRQERKLDPTFDRQVHDACEIRGDISGGKSVVTDEVKETIVNVIKEQKVRPMVAAQKCGVSHAAVQRARKMDPDFDEAVFAADRFVCNLVEDVLVKTALKGNVRACETVLYNRMPDRWASPRTLERRANALEAKAMEEIEAQARQGGVELSLVDKQAAVADMLSDISQRVSADNRPT